MPIPSPSERPDLYDDFDLPERPPGYKTGIATPPQIQRLIEAKIRDQSEGTNIHFAKALQEDAEDLTQSATPAPEVTKEP